MDLRGTLVLDEDFLVPRGGGVRGSSSVVSRSPYRPRVNCFYLFWATVSVENEFTTSRVGSTDTLIGRVLVNFLRVRVRGVKHNYYVNQTRPRTVVRKSFDEYL